MLYVYISYWWNVCVVNMVVKSDLLDKVCSVVVCFASQGMCLWAPKSQNKECREHSGSGVSGGRMPLDKGWGTITLSHQWLKRLFCRMTVEECYRWLVQSKHMTSRQLQGFCYCSVSWFRSPVHTSYVWSLDVFLYVHELHVTRITPLRGHRWFLCFGTGGLPDVPSSVLQNGKCLIKRPCWFCQSWGTLGFTWFPLSP